MIKAAPSSTGVQKELVVKGGYSRPAARATTRVARAAARTAARAATRVVTRVARHLGNEGASFQRETIETGVCGCGLENLALKNSFIFYVVVGLKFDFVMPFSSETSL